MKIDLNSIHDPQVRFFYQLYIPQHQILLDFYNLLAEEQYDFRMVDTMGRKSDTPRESLAHILYVQLVYLTSVLTGELEFKSMGVEHYKEMTKEQLLVEARRIDKEMFSQLTAESFDSNRRVAVPWGGEMGAINCCISCVSTISCHRLESGFDGSYEHAAPVINPILVHRTASFVKQPLSRMLQGNPVCSGVEDFVMEERILLYRGWLNSLVADLSV
jgi:hypothetical protein